MTNIEKIGLDPAVTASMNRFKNDYLAELKKEDPEEYKNIMKLERKVEKRK